MSRRAGAALVAACCFAVAGLGQPASCQAGVIPDIWWFLFGPPGTTWVAPTYPGYTAGYAPGYAAYYGGSCSPCRTSPRVYYYAPLNPCNPCSPCPVTCPTACAQGCNPCQTGGPCGISPQSPTPAGNGGAPQTFRKPSNGSAGAGGAKKPPVPGKDDSQFRSRDNTKKFAPTRKKKTESPFGAPDSKTPGSSDGSDQPAHKTFRPPTGGTPDAGPSLKKKPAPPKPPVNGTPEKKNAGPRLDVPRLDRAITWKLPTRRTRLIIRPVMFSPRLTRTSVDPNRGWQPVPQQGTPVVQK